MITDGAVHVRMIVRDMENVVPVWHITAIMALFNQSDESHKLLCFTGTVAFFEDDLEGIMLLFTPFSVT